MTVWISHLTRSGVGRKFLVVVKMMENFYARIHLAFLHVVLPSTLS